MLPPAPVLCSMMIGWPHFAWSLSATMRARMSLMPPAGNGTMNLTGLPGNRLSGGKLRQHSHHK